VPTTALASLATDRRPRLPAGPLIRATYANLRSSPLLVLRPLAPWYSVVVMVACIRLVGHWTEFGAGYDAWLSKLAAGAAFLGGFFIMVHWNRVILVRKGVPQARILSLRALRFLAMLAIAAALVLVFGAAAVGSLAVLGAVPTPASLLRGVMLLIAFIIGHPVATIVFDALATGFTFLAVTLASTFGALAYAALADHRP